MREGFIISNFNQVKMARSDALSLETDCGDNLSSFILQHLSKMNN
jgi:hypothetical protein